MNTAMLRSVKLAMPHSDRYYRKYIKRSPPFRLTLFWVALLAPTAGDASTERLAHATPFQDSELAISGLATSDPQIEWFAEEKIYFIKTKSCADFLAFVLISIQCP